MKPLRFLFFLLMAGISSGFSQDCQTVSAVPDGQLKLASGKIVLENDGVAPIKGGREVYAKLTNNSQVERDVSYVVAVEILETSKEGAKHFVTNCLSQGTLLHNASAVVSGSSPADPPVQWRVSVSFGPSSADEDIGEILDYEVYSNPPKPKTSSPRK